MPQWLATVAALTVLLVLGDGVLRMAARGVRLAWYERCALAWLCGTGAATIAWVLLAPAYRWLSPVWLVTAMALMLALAARRPDARRKGSGAAGVTFSPTDAMLAAVVLLQVGVLCAAAMWTTLGWDGLFNFELKARIAFEHSPAGQLPAAYFQDATRSWSHPRYPLLVPFTEFWIYSWLGRIDQSAVKIVFPLFYCSLIALVCGAVRRVASLRWALVTAIGLGCLPVLTLLPGASSGYADVPLAASACGAACFAFGALRTQDARYVNLAAALLAVAVWTKAEGAILAGAIGLTALAAAGSTARRRFSALVWVPALAVASWYAVLTFHGAEAAKDFHAPGSQELASTIDALAAVWPAVMRELIRPGHWGLIWPAFFAAVLFMMTARQSTRADWFLVGAVVIPLGVYAALYLFSAWPDVREHVGFSLPRLLVPLAPVATFFVVRRAAYELGVESTEWA